MGKLTAQTVKTAKPESKLTDGAGLYLLVKQSGKYWRYDYRYLKKRKTLALGVFHVISLKEAREKHHTAKQLLDKGIDPSHHKKLVREMGQADHHLQTRVKKKTAIPLK